MARIATENLRSQLPCIISALPQSSESWLTTIRAKKQSNRPSEACPRLYTKIQENMQHVYIVTV